MTPPEYGRGFPYQPAQTLADELERAVAAFYPEAWCIRLHAIVWNIKDSRDQFPHLTRYPDQLQKRCISQIFRNNGWTKIGEGRNVKFIRAGAGVPPCTP